MVSDEIMLKVENVSKIYKLGEIGGTTVREELQRLWARIRKKDDPTKKIGAKNYNKGEKFKALDNVSFEVKKGERIGIIGHNGAGKSTLLKLISRVTGPSKGQIYLNGRVASMLEVGTGFHPELTGRENVYMNGAILGMTKKEIDAKIEDIIEFSEVRKFIDTPVKRYSSGMYVKLAFSVAAHLDSEIMIMDEVLAVGDAQFQQKCISKMKSVSEESSKTVLYVSHNMNTIRQLCDRVIVLNHGNIIFNGNVDEAIAIYLNNYSLKQKIYDYSNVERPRVFSTGLLRMTQLKILNKNNEINFKDQLSVELNFECLKKVERVFFRFTFYSLDRNVVGSCFTDFKNYQIGTHVTKLVFDTSNFIPGQYFAKINAISFNEIGTYTFQDVVNDALFFDIVHPNEKNNYFDSWNSSYRGHILIDLIENE